MALLAACWRVRSLVELELSRLPEHEHVGAALHVGVGDAVLDHVALLVEGLLAGHEVVTGGLETQLGRREALLHAGVLELGLVELAAHGAELGLRRVELGAGLGRGRERLLGRLAGLLEVVCGALDLLLDLLLLVLEVVIGMSERDGQSTQDQRTGRGGRCEAVARGAGEGAHRIAFDVGEESLGTVRRAAQTLTYLRVSASVGSSVSTGPSTATTPSATT